MVEVINFQIHLAIKRLNEFDRRSCDVVSEISQFKRDCTCIRDELEVMLSIHQRFIAHLGGCMRQLDRTLDFAECCAEACELDSLEDMIQERDRLVRSRPN